MSEILEQLRSDVAALQESPSGYARRLRNEFARLILERIDELVWTQSTLANEAGMPESSISRLIHGRTNWETETAGRVLFALGILPMLTAKRVVQRPSGTSGKTFYFDTAPWSEFYGQANFTTQATAVIFTECATRPDSIRCWWGEVERDSIYPTTRPPVALGRPDGTHSETGHVEGSDEFLRSDSWAWGQFGRVREGGHGPNDTACSRRLDLAKVWT